MPQARVRGQPVPQPSDPNMRNVTVKYAVAVSHIAVYGNVQENNRNILTREKSVRCSASTLSEPPQGRRRQAGSSLCYRG